MMRNLMLVLAYDGTDFHGWQYQPGIRTVQECVEIALRRTVRHRVAIVGCSRTDAGVHAAGYVANLYTTSPTPDLGIARSLAARLPPDLALVHLEEVPLTFHAPQSAISKLYRYRIHDAGRRPVDRFCHRHVYHPRHSMEIDRMREAAAHLVGRHDFTSFASAGVERQSNVRTIHRIDLTRAGPEIRIDVEGDGFLYKQVRNIVGTLCEIGRGHWAPDRAGAILAARDRAQAGP
ncbi:MAG: tRNA pseudouridine(38-40) synthase TruA, partial [Phycisphaerae bacterium]